MAMFHDESLTETMLIEDGLQLLPECGQGGCSSHRRGQTVPGPRGCHCKCTVAKCWPVRRCENKHVSDSVCQILFTSTGGHILTILLANSSDNATAAAAEAATILPHQCLWCIKCLKW